MLDRFVLIACVALPVLWALRWIRRALFAKDYAYAFLERVGPLEDWEARVRICRRMPWLSAETVESWFPDFELVNRRIDELSRAGGPQRLGRRRVKAALRKDFPFLRFEGLSRAAWSAGFHAMISGWDRDPRP